MPEPDPSPTPVTGLRERKKLRTRAAIQKEALRLFLEKGFQATTIDEIAAAVEISPSTFFNYFPSKEDVVLQDDLDPVIFAAFNAQPAELGPIGALRHAMIEVFSNLTPDQRSLMRDRAVLLASEPELRAAFLNQFMSIVDQLAELIARRVGRPRSFAMRNLSGALLGVMMAALLAAGENPDADLVHLTDQAMSHLEAGLPLEWEG